jgi:hypothetical protein
LALAKADYDSKVTPSLAKPDLDFFNKHYKLNKSTDEYEYAVANTEKQVEKLRKIASQIDLDLKTPAQLERQAVTQFVVAQFRQDAFYGDTSLNSHFKPAHHFHENENGVFTFMMEAMPIRILWEQDLSIYRLVAPDARVLAALPAAVATFDEIAIGDTLYPLQNSPTSDFGRLVNRSVVEGLLDEHSPVRQHSIVRQGSRYLIKGFFRFGSSGAPYFRWNADEARFEVVAIQSAAAPIQLTVGGSMQDNFQWVSGIATPLAPIKSELDALVSP